MKYTTVDQAAKRLGMEKAEFVGSAIEHDIWVGTVLGAGKIRFFKGSKLQPFLTRLDATVNTEKLQPLYVEYPDSALEYMPAFDYLRIRHSDISINSVRIPYKELYRIKREIGHIQTLKRKLNIVKYIGVLKTIWDIIRSIF